VLRERLKPFTHVLRLSDRAELAPAALDEEVGAVRACRPRRGDGGS
jgi:hypothetical protein